MVIPETKRVVVWVLDITHAWVKTVQHSAVGEIADRSPVNILVELVSINKKSRPLTVATLHVNAKITPRISGASILELKREMSTFTEGKQASVGEKIQLPDDHDRFDIQIRIRGDSDVRLEDLTFNYSYHVEHEEVEVKNIPKSQALDDFGAW